MKRAKRAAAYLVLLTVVSIAVGGQTAERTIEDRLVAFTQQLRMGMALASVATYSPTLDDLRLHAQQLINLLEGAGGKHVVRPSPLVEAAPGLLVEVVALGPRFDALAAEADIRVRIRDAAKNVRTFLSYALEAALSAVDGRRIDRASADMLRAYAFLLAAYERPCDTPYVPALWTILRTYGIVERIGAENES